MRVFGLRQRVIIGVGAAALAFLVASLIGYRLTERRFIESVAHNLTTTAELEAARIGDVLERAHEQLTEIANRSQVNARTQILAKSGEGAEDLAAALDNAAVASGEFLGLTVEGPNWTVRSESYGHDPDEPHPPFPDDSVYGDTFQTPDGTGVVHIRARIAVPGSISSDEDAWLVGEYSMRPIQELIATNAAGGDTLEAHIARLLPNGDVQFITPLRFEPDAAFTKIVPGDRSHLPIVQAANGAETVLVDVNDYRQQPSILALHPIEATGWGLVVKVDSAEATAPIDDLLRILLVGILISTVVALAAMLLLIRPILTRIKAIEDAANAVNDGDYRRRINDPNKDELGAVAKAVDVAVETMEASIEEKSRFVAAVSHELRTPLTAVMGLSSTIASDVEQFSQADIAELSQMIHSSANDLATLVDDLLTAARMQSDSLVIDNVNLDLYELTQTTIAKLSPEIVAKVTLDSDGDLGAHADEVRVQQILRNLVVNAHKYGGDQIVVRSATLTGHVCIEVCDNGDGVAPEFAEKIFDPYERAHQTIGTTDSVGLGLNIARELAEMMDGNLLYRRDEGWTVFELRLPRSTMTAGSDPGN